MKEHVCTHPLPPPEDQGLLGSPDMAQGPQESPGTLCERAGSPGAPRTPCPWRWSTLSTLHALSPAEAEDSPAPGSQQ